MKISKHKLSLGELEIVEITLQNSRGITVSFLSYGGIITRIEVPDNQGKLENIVLAYHDYEDYLDNSLYLGALIGRTAGRIKNGSFTIDENKYDVARNYGENSGHGGIKGFDKHLYDIEVVELDDRIDVVLSRVSPHMEEGYPGELFVKATYSLSEEDTFSIHYDGVSTMDTLFNMTNHSYFNLSGSFNESIKYHELLIDADHYAEIDESKAPTGHLLKVSGTPFDFRHMREIGEEMDLTDQQLNIANGYDHGFLLNDHKEVKIRLAHRYSGRVMEIMTDNQAVVVYTQNYAQGQNIQGGITLEPYRSIALEVQRLPIGSNEAFKEASVLSANKSRKTSTVFRFFTDQDHRESR